MQFLLIHSLPFHYEILGNFFELFKDFGDIDLLFHRSVYGSELDSWLSEYKKLFKNITLLETVQEEKDYDLILIPTDNDDKSIKVYRTFYADKKLYTMRINSIEGNRSRVSPLKLIDLPQQGTLKFDEDVYHTFSYNAIDVYDKLENVYPNKIRVLVIGDIINRDKNFLDNMKNRIENFDDVEVNLVNRFDYEKELPSNVNFHKNLDPIELMRLYEQTDYVYFFPERANNFGIQCSGSFVHCVAYLNKFICMDEFKETYRIDKFGTFCDFNGSIKLTKPTEDELKEMKIERDLMLYVTKAYLRDKLEEIMEKKPKTKLIINKNVEN
jgi:hypothetical protein